CRCKNHRNMGLLRTLLASVAKRRNPVEFLNCTVATLHVRRDEIGPPFVTRTRGIRRIPYDQIVSWGYGDFVAYDESAPLWAARRGRYRRALTSVRLLLNGVQSSFLRGNNPKTKCPLWVKSRQHTCLQAVLTRRSAALTGGPTDMPELQKHRATFGWHAASPTT